MKHLREHIRLGIGGSRRVGAVLVVLAVVASTVWLSWSWLTYWAWSARALAVSTVSPSGPAVTRDIPFRYRGRTRFLSVTVSEGELVAAKALPTGEIFAQPGKLRDAYLRTLVGTQSRSPAVASVARQLRSLRTRLRLDDDEYVELLTAAVQDVPYGTPRSSFQLPVEALAAGRGVCIDRSVLLAALLVHEGYDAGLWTLSADNHVAVALRGVGAGYRRSGYAYIEATRRAYVGEVPERYVATATWQPSPRLVVFGRGKPYRADAETALIVDERKEAERLARDLAPYRPYAATAAARWRETYLREVRRQERAASLASQLAAAVDDRDLAFATLAKLQGWGVDPRGL